MATLETTRLPAVERPTGLRLGGSSLLCTAGLVLLAFVVLAPIVFLVVNSFQLARPGGAVAYGLQNWVVALTEPGMLEAVGNTFSRTAVSLGLAFPVAVFVAWLLARTDLPGKNWLDLLFWMTFFMPILPITLGWILLLDPEFGLLNQAIVNLLGIEKGPFNIYSFAGIVWVHLVTRTVVVMIILLVPAFRNMDSSFEEASRVSGVGYLGTMVRVFLPIMAPVLTVVLLMGVIYSIESFEIEQVLGPQFNFYVYSTKIYQLIIREPAQYGAATALSTLILLVMLPAILLQQRISRGRGYTTITGRYRAQAFPLGQWKWPAFGLVAAMAFVFTILPLCLLVLGSFMRLFGFFTLADPYTTRHWQAVLGDPNFLRSLQNSLIIGVSTALVVVILCSLIAYVVIKTRYAARGALDVLSWLPVTIPGVIMGLGLLWLFLNIPLVRPLYGTMAVLVWATALSSMTLGVQLVKSHLLQLSDELEECSRVAGGDWLYTFRRVVLPLVTPVLITVAIVAFISAVRNVAHVAILVTSSTRPLAMFQLNLMVDGQYEAAAVVGVIVVVLTTGVAILARAFGLRLGVRA
ncbi:MAG TPA: iron ABC transporter permease [Chloroflexota bacterium]|jgi:iron(III) transport system permease protein